MYHFEYLTRAKRAEVKEPILELITEVQKDLKKQFTFQYKFSGSDELNMITYDPRTNTGFDFDINIEVNDPNNNFSAKQIKQSLMNSFNKFLKKYGFDFCEDSTRVFTFKAKDRKRSLIKYSCDIAVVNNYNDEDGYWHQQIIYFNKSQNSYEWKEQPSAFYTFWDRVDKIKEGGFWSEVRDLYLEKKNNNRDLNKKSTSLRREAVNEVFLRHFDVEE